MIPGLEYEPDGGPALGHTHASPPGDTSFTSVDMSPQHHRADRYGGELHRRRGGGGGGGYGTNGTSNGGGGRADDDDKYAKRAKAVRRLDFFPKTERDYTVRTERGGQLTAAGYAIMAVLILAEYLTWRGLNGESLEHIAVDTR